MILKALSGWAMIIIACALMSILAFYLLAVCAWFVTFSTVYFHITEWSYAARGVLMAISFVMWGWLLYFLAKQD